MNIKKCLSINFLLTITVNLLAVPMAYCGGKGNSNYRHSHIQTKNNGYKSKDVLKSRKIILKAKRYEQKIEAAFNHSMNTQIANWLAEYASEYTGYADDALPWFGQLEEFAGKDNQDAYLIQGTKEFLQCFGKRQDYCKIGRQYAKNITEAKHKKNKKHVQFVAGATKFIVGNLLKLTKRPVAALVMTFFVIGYLAKRIYALETDVPQFYSPESAGVQNINQNGDTQLHKAVREKDKEAVKKLLKQNVDLVDAVNKNGEKPIAIAMKQGNENIVKLLAMPKSALRDCLHKEKATQMFKKAFLANDSEKLDWLLEECDVDLDSTIDATGNTPLYIAAEKGNLEIVQAILKHKDIDVNKLGHRDRTPLYVAVINGHLEVVKELLKHEDIDVNKLSEVNPFGSCGKTPLCVLTRFMDHKFEYLEIAKELLKHEDIDVNKLSGNCVLMPPLYSAVENGRLEMVKELLKHKDIDVNKPGRDIYIKRYDKQTPLYVAVDRGDLEMVEELLKHKDIDVNKLGGDYEGEGPLYAAIKRNCQTTFQELLKHENIKLDNIKLAEFSRKGENAYDVAKRYGRKEIIKLLPRRKWFGIF